MRHTFRLISLLSLHDNDLKFPDAVYCSTFDGGPKLKTSNSFSFSQLGYGLNNSRPGEFDHLFFVTFLLPPPVCNL